jgi:hypothetical protein
MQECFQTCWVAWGFLYSDSFNPPTCSHLDIISFGCKASRLAQTNPKCGFQLQLKLAFNSVPHHLIHANSAFYLSRP